MKKKTFKLLYANGLFYHHDIVHENNEDPTQLHL